MGFASSKTFYRSILECCEAADTSGSTPAQIRAYADDKVGKFLTASELDQLRKPKPGAKGNYFEWALAHLVQYKFLSGPPRYALTESGNRLAAYLRKNASAQVDLGFLKRF